MTLPQFDDVLAARDRIAGRAVRTPMLLSPLLSERLGGRIYLKLEILQRTGSFKFRGAWNAVQALGDRAKNGVVASSSGNHAQGLAEAARLAGIKATIVMPNDAPRIKRERTEASGAKVVGYDRATEDRDAISQRIADDDDAVIVHPFNNAMVIAGQGTVGLEIAEDFERAGETPDIVVVPCGGGGLSAGTALTVTTMFPGCAVYAAEPRDFDDYARSLSAGRIVSNDRLSGSICDALLSPAPGAIGWEINSRRLAGAASATDDEVLWAVGYAFDALRLIVEPGGAAALAAVLAGRIDVRGKTCVVVLSGGNIADEMLAKAVGRYRSGELPAS